MDRPPPTLSHAILLAILLLGFTAAHAAVLRPDLSPAPHSHGGYTIRVSTGAAPDPTTTSTLAAALALAAGRPSATTICLERGSIHTLLEPLQLNASHSNIIVRPCTDSDTRASPPLIAGGVVVDGWQPVANSPLFAAPVPAAAQPLQYARQLYVAAGGAAMGDLEAFVRANRTRLNATAALGDLRVLAHGYGASRPVPWNTSLAGGGVELVYFQQVRPWTSPRCVVAGAEESTGTLTVAEPCFSRLQQQLSHPPTNASRNFGSGLPLYIENTPLTPQAPGQPGDFWFDAAAQMLYYHARAADLSSGPAAGSDAPALSSTLVLPVAEALVNGSGMADTTFAGIDFAFAAWNQPSTAEGYVSIQAGLHLVDAAGGGTAEVPILGAVTCNNCQRVVVSASTLAHLGGAGVSLGGTAQHCAITRCRIFDVSASAVQLGDVTNPTTTDPDLMSTGNVLAQTVMEDLAKEYTGCTAVWGGYHRQLQVVHNNISRCAYGGISIGWGWASMNVTYARDNLIAGNYITEWLRLLQDSGAIYVLGPQPNSTMRENFIFHQVLTGVEPRPPCEALNTAGRCTVDELIALEGGGCTAGAMCNHTNANAKSVAHGGGFYTDDGSRFWEVCHNVAASVYHWAFVWNDQDMHDMRYHDNFSDSPLFTNNAAKNNVSFANNVLVPAGGPWPAAATAIMAAAGAHWSA